MRLSTSAPYLRAIRVVALAAAALSSAGALAACSGTQPESRAAEAIQVGTAVADPLTLRCPAATATATASASATATAPATAPATASADRPRQAIQGRHTRGVTQLAFSPDGKLLASSSLDRSVRIWDAARRDELRVLHRPTRNVSLGIAWNDAGKSLLVSGFRETSALVDVATGIEIGSLETPLPRVFQRIEGASEHRFIGRTTEGLALLDETGRPAPLPPPPNTQGEAKIAEFTASDGASIVLAASAPYGRSLFLWSKRDAGGFDVRPLPIDDAARVGAIALTASGDAAIVEIEQPTRRFELLIIPLAAGAGAPRPLALPPDIQAKGVHRLAISRDGSLLVATADESLLAWDLISMRLRFQRSLEGARAPESTTRWEGSPVAISPDGRAIAAGTFTGTIALYNASTGRYRGDYGAASAVRYARDVVFAGADKIGVLSTDHVTGWSIPEARVLGAEPAASVLRLERSASGGMVKVRFADPAVEPSCGPDRQRVFFDGQADQSPICVAARPPESRGSALMDVSLSARRAIGITSFKEGPALIDLTTGAAIPLARTRGGGGEGSPDDQAPTTTKAASPPRGSAPAPAPAPIKKAAALATTEDPCIWPTNAVLSPDGRLAAATGSSDGNTCVWNAITGARLLAMKVDPSRSRRGFSNRVAFAPDGRTLAIARDDKIVLVSLPGGAVASSITAGARVVSMAFAGEGGLLLAGAEDGSLITLRDGTINAKGRSDGGSLRSITVHPGGLLAATVSDDGAVRLWDTRAANLRASFAAFDDDEWIAATPGGAYAGTLEVGDRIGWVFDAPVERFGFERFAEAFLAPDLVRRRARGEDVDTAVAARRPPRVELKEASGAPAPEARTAVLHAHASSQGRVESVRVFAGGRAVAAALVCAREGDVELSVPLDPGPNRLTVVAFDDQGFASNEVAIDVEGAPLESARAGSREEPDVWIVAVGVSDYPALAPAFQLGVADDDARSVAAAFRAMEGGAYRRAHAVTLTDAQATPAAIRRAIADLSAMKAGDLAVVFFAGHGIKPGASEDMMFLTGGPADPARPPLAKLTGEIARRDGIGWKEISAALGAVRGRVLVMLDACHSGHLTQEVVVPNEALAGALARGERASVLVLAAAKGRQLSLEPATSRGLELEAADKPAVRFSVTEPHGFFTGALLAALADPSTDRDESGTIEASELMDEVKGRVTRLTRGAQTPWVARRDLFGDFMLARSQGRR